MSSNQPEISLIIVSWNARDYLLNCIESIYATMAGVRFEIIVVDNASSDGSPEGVKERFPGVHLIQTGANLGFSRANNIGVARATGRYYGFVNSDVLVLPDCVQRLIALMDSHPAVGLAGPRLLNGDRTLQPSCRKEPRLANHLARALFINTSLADPACKRDEIAEVEVLAGSFWIARREAVQQVGLLDEAFFFYGEDVDWCRRFRAAGQKVCYFPSAQAVHFGGASSAADPDRFNTELLRATLKLWEKHHGWLSTQAFLAISILHQSLRVCRSIALNCFRSARKQARAKVEQHGKAVRWLATQMARRWRVTFPSSQALGPTAPVRSGDSA